MFRTASFIAALALVLTACDSNGPVDEVRVESNSVVELAADPGQRDPNTGQVNDTGQFTLYSLRDGEVVLNYDEENRADSSSTQWDIGFSGTTIIVNGGTSGPGTGGAIVVEEAYDALPAVPAGTTFRVDGSAECPAVTTPGGTFPGTPRAICTGGGNGWYTYIGGAIPKILPTPGRTILVRTADGEGFAKVRINNYYQGQPSADEITASTPGRYYTFEYVINEDGQTFEAEED